MHTDQLIAMATWLTIGGGGAAIVRAVHDARTEARAARGHDESLLDAERRLRIAWMECAAIGRRIALELGATREQIGPTPDDAD